MPPTTFPAPTACAASSESGAKSLIPTPTPPGPEDPPISVLLSGYSGYLNKTDLLHSTVTAVGFSSVSTSTSTLFSNVTSTVVDYGRVATSTSTSTLSSNATATNIGSTVFTAAASRLHLGWSLGTSSFVAIGCVVVMTVL